VALSVAVVGAVALTACSGGRLPPPAATVQGSTITQDDVATEVQVILSLSTPAARASFEGPGATNRVEDLNRNALAFMIRQELVDAYADEHGVAPTPAEVDQALQQTITAAGGRPEVERQLAQRGLTDADVREFQRQLSTLQAVQVALAPGGNQQAQDAAFGDWITQTLSTTPIDVNPRFGALDLQSAGLQPITSTGQLG
jgi:hypothetical protein